ncbi:FHA domain-containing protein [Sulfidibacter corallicola]|uniref:histidine kinase n=1 Tax=Sulfidibacter corallicola TaxID=2818388 RepID=A0A8A4TRV1_SULCO|nr:FHA domain-containing protein [Sulfidibacter corallicola]QTD51894.1 FHA domain-containing protein [Sulfidibacter corallicola]
MKLHIIPGESEPFFHMVQGTNLVIGRSPSADLVIPEQSISRRHARMFCREKQWFIEDLGSHNGTVVNDYLVRHPTVLTPGAVVRLSNAKIIVNKYQEDETLTGDHDRPMGSHRLFKSASEMLDSAPGNVLTVEGEQELRRAADRLKLLNDIHAALSHPITREELLDLVLERVFGLLNPEEGAIFLKDADGEFTPAATRTVYPPANPHTFTYSRSLVREVTEKRMAALVADAENDERFSGSNSIVGMGVRSLVAAPLLDSEGALGMIVLVSRAFVRQFSEEDMALLVSLASVAALRLRNMILVDEAAEQLRRLNRTLEKKVAERTRELQARNEELAGLDRVVRMTNRELALDRVVQTILDQGLILFPQTERGAYLQWDERCEVFRFAATAGYETEQLGDVSFTRAELEKNYMTSASEVHEGVFLRRTLTDELDTAIQPGATLSMAVNLNDRLVGYLVLDCFSRADAFDEADARKLERYREHAISAVAKARYVQELHDKNQEIVRKQSQLIMKEKMASIGTLAAGIAHEIKNPLNFINNLAEVADELVRDLEDKLGECREQFEADDFDQIRDLVQDLEQNAGVSREQGRKADRIVTSMMDLAQASSKNRRLVDFNALIEKYSSMAYHGIGDLEQKNCPLVIEKELDSEVGMVVVGPQSLSRTVINLVTNAIESVLTKWINLGDGYQPQVQVSTVTQSEVIELRVRDNGMGIPAADRDRIFTPFFTTKPGGKNIGLGLSIAYDIVVLEHHGSFDVQTLEGEHTEMIVRIPRTLREE